MSSPGTVLHTQRVPGCCFKLTNPTQCSETSSLPWNEKTSGVRPSPPIEHGRVVLGTEGPSFIPAYGLHGVMALPTSTSTTTQNHLTQREQKIGGAALAHLAFGLHETVNSFRHFDG